MAKRKHTKKKRSMPVVRIGEFATPERRHQLGGVMTEAVDREADSNAPLKRHRARLECMLDYYLKTNRISDAQYVAGLKFREVYLRVNYGYHCKVLCQPFLMEAGHAAPEWKLLAHIDCVRRLQEACKLLTPEQQKIVRNVCGYDGFAGGRDNKRILLRALDILAAHWGIR